jgi:isopenicillin N synthase-like dioxygenase
MMALPTDITVAPLATISLRALQKRDAQEMTRLYDACATDGFFYLDLSGVGTLVDDWQNMLSIITRYFEQPLEVKILDDRQSDTHGCVSPDPWDVVC